MSRAYREPNGELRFYFFDGSRVLLLFLIDMLLDRSMRLGVGEAQALLREYSGPQYEVESNMMTVITLLFILILFSESIH